MKMLVTGAKGMLGQDLCPALEDSGHEVIETDVDNMDITSSVAVLEFTKKQKPDFLIHLAAYTNVDKAEEDRETAYKINVEGTQNLVNACKKLDIPMLYISTDYVFDGTKKGKYTPEDKRNPINYYGETKAKGEEAVQTLEKYYITRTSWLYGHHGKNFVETMLSLASKPELKVVDDQIGCPTWTVELVNGIVKIIEEQMPYGIYQVCGSGHTSWYGVAKEIFELHGDKVNLFPCKTEEFPRPANRPRNSIMENQGLCRSWKAALKDYLSLRSEE